MNSTCNLITSSIIKFIPNFTKKNFPIFAIDGFLQKCTLFKSTPQYFVVFGFLIKQYNMKTRTQKNALK